jgi:hypothetical protein
MGPIPLIPAFNIFCIDDGQDIWHGGESTLHAAISRVQVDASRPSEYAIRCLKTDHEVFVRAEHCWTRGLRFCVRWQST